MIRWWKLGLAVGLIGALSWISKADVSVLRDGQIVLPVVIADGAAPEEKAAANELAGVLGKMSGLNWPVIVEKTTPVPGLHIGRTPSAGHWPALKLRDDIFGTEKDGVGPDAFRIRSDQGSVFVEAATPEATSYAVAWLLQRYGGVRWYCPGKYGEVVPRRKEWSLPEVDEVRQPAYLSREISGLAGRENEEWAERNGLRKHLDFSHALQRIFPREVLAAHPDWCPLLERRRYVPDSAEDNRWQPNLALPEVSEFAANKAAAAFERSPGLLSFSLGVNDTVRFDQSDETRKQVEPLNYFRGRPDFSPLVFGFMNRVAEAMPHVHDGRYLGCLAYFWCENPPKFPVNRRVVPFVTADRSQYYDDAFRTSDVELMSRWQDSGVAAYGLWEYGEGYGFLVPREPYHAFFDALREGARRGARGYFADVGPQWGFDEFKIWALARLLWEPEMSYEELADDFFSGSYGDASISMRRFFELCEKQWMQQAGEPYWLKYYQQEDQALLFPQEVCRELRGLLDASLEKAWHNQAAFARIARTSRAFAVTEAFVAFDQIRREIEGLDVTSLTPNQIKITVELVRDFVRSKTRLEVAYADACAGDFPAMVKGQLVGLTRDDPVPRIIWLAGQRDPSAPAEFLKKTEAVPLAWQKLVEFIAGGKMVDAPNRILNASFAELGDSDQEPRFLHPLSGKLPKNWFVRAMPTETSRVELGRSPNGLSSLRVEGAWDTQVYQWLPAIAGKFYVTSARIRGQSSPGCDAALFLSFLSADGKPTGEHWMQSLPKGTTSEEWTAALAEAAPSNAAWVGVGVCAYRQATGDWLEIRSVSLIDCDSE